jgi:hypothetical protein
MPAKEIKELRQAGKLDEAHLMAKAELEAEPENIWGKRNMSWVLYSQLDAAAGNLPAFFSLLNELAQLALPESEEMFFDNISIVISKAARSISKAEPIDLNKLHQLFDAIKSLPLKRDSKWFSVLYSAFHKGLKDSPRYIEFADWWNFENFPPEAYQKEKLPNGKEIMALAEQAYIAYAKHLLPQYSNYDEIFFDKEKAEAFLPKLHQVVDDYPQFQYPAYFLAKLLLALGDKENMLSALLPFAKKKQNDFWVWQILGEAFSADEEKVFACNCKALSCYSPEEMLVTLRQKMAGMFFKRQLFIEAKTEIELLVASRTSHEFKIPTEVINWQSQEWYKNAIAKKSNIDFYKKYTGVAEALLFSDVPEETVMVDFVNSDKKMLNFIVSENRFGYFKYDRFLRDAKIGDTLKVRFQSGSNEGLYKVYTVVKANDDTFRKQFYKEIEGDLKIPQGKPFGFLGDAFVHPSIVTRRNLTNGMHLKGNAIKSYNPVNKKLDWKLL